ncbi:IS200/IS605 family transposase [Pectobacterium parmentieri]|nr:IS200/IS605 family transposase [Pectobacterium parmentieri]
MRSGNCKRSTRNQKGVPMRDEKSLAHTRWNCKYHIVFAPKYRRQVFYGEKRKAIGSILRKLCEWKNVNILEEGCCVDHIHMLLEIPLKMSVWGFMGYLEGKSSLMLYEQFGDLKFKYRNREFWCRGYYVDTVGKNTVRIQEYIKHQLAEDKMGEQLSIPYPGSPFTGRK